MGFNKLILINPSDYLSPEAIWMAHASKDILENVKVYSSLNEAIADKNFIVATSQRPRSSHLPYFTLKELVKKIIPISIDHKVAIVFGREKSGLTNEELATCDAVSTIPANTRHPSLNLSQSVMIYSYEFFQAAYEDLKKYPWKLAKHEDLESLYKHLRESLNRIGFIPIDSWENFILRFSRLLGRANAEVRDVRVWHKIFKSFDQYIDQLESKINNKADD